MQRLRDQVALLQRNAEKDQELLCRKDEELHNRRRPSPPSSHSGRDGHSGGGGYRNKRRDRKSPHHYKERERNPFKERTVSPPPHKVRREEQGGGGGGRGFRGPLPHSRVLATPHVSSKDSISKAQNWISQSPFSEEIEKIDLPKRFTRPTFTIYNGKTDSVEHVSHYNQSMAIYFE